MTIKYNSEIARNCLRHFYRGIRFFALIECLHQAECGRAEGGPLSQADESGRAEGDPTGGIAYIVESLTQLVY